MKKTLRETLTKDSSTAEIFGEIHSRKWALLADGIEPIKLTTTDFEGLETDFLEDLYVISEFDSQITKSGIGFSTLEEAVYRSSLKTTLERRGYEMGLQSPLHTLVETLVIAVMFGSSHPAPYSKLVNPQRDRAMEPLLERQRERDRLAA